MLSQWKEPALRYPVQPGYCLTNEKRIPFENDVEIAIGNQNGVYVAAGKTYFLAGRQIGAEMEVRQILHYGAVPGTEFSIESGDPEHHTVGWFGENGIIFADTNGVVSEIMASTIKQTPPDSGVSVVLDTNDIYKVVSCGWCANEGTRAVSRYADWPVTSESVGYATMPDGVYLLSGGTGVDCRLDLGKKNFGTENKKRFLPSMSAQRLPSRLSSSSPRRTVMNLNTRQEVVATRSRFTGSTPARVAGKLVWACPQE